MYSISEFIEHLTDGTKIDVEQLIFYKIIISLFEETKYEPYNKEISFEKISEAYFEFYWNLNNINNVVVFDEYVYNYEKIIKFINNYKNKNGHVNDFFSAKQFILDNMRIEYSLIIDSISKRIKKRVLENEQEYFRIKKDILIILSKICFEIEEVSYTQQLILKNINSRIIKNNVNDEIIEQENNEVAELDEKLVKIKKQLSVKEIKNINSQNIDIILKNMLEERKSIKVYDLVTNKSFGNGLVTKVKENNIFEIYFFDSDKHKNIEGNFLNRIVLKSSENIKKQDRNIVYKSEVGYCEVNDVVYHDLYGNGVVEAVKDKFAIVKFEEQAKTKMVFSKYLKILGKKSIEEKSEVVENIESVLDNLIQDEKEISYLADNELIKYPKTIIEGIYSKEEVAVYNYLKKTMNKGMIAFGSNEISFTKKIGLIIKRNKGVFAYIVLPMMIDEFCESYEMLEKIILIQQEKMINKLLNSKLLFSKINDCKILKFPFKFGIVLPNIDEELLIDKNIKCKNIYFKDFLKKEIFENINHPFDANFIEISKEESIGILERFIPEYTTILFKEELKNEEENNSQKINEEKELSKVTGNEYEYKVLELEEEQIRHINNLKPEITLTLANPGTGKSVILLSNAYRVSKLYDENVLITCYNRNLIDKYKYEYEISGLKNGNDSIKLNIQSFDSLISQIYLEKYGTYFDKRRYPTEEEAYNALFEEVFEIVKDKEIREHFKYKAIFIDEIQLFESKWIDFYYLLLNGTRENTFFQMYGDINQDVKRSRRKGQASWQKTDILPKDYKVNYLKKNYRNTIEINNYLINILNLLNDRLEYFGEKVNKSDYVLDSTAHKKGTKPQIIEVNGNVLAQRVLDAIIELKEKYNIGYNDICLVFPYEQYRFIRYYPKLWITQKFNELGIPYSEIYGENKVGLMNTSGITITTIESSLGLDFKAVVLCGLKPLNWYWPIDAQSAYLIRNEDDIKRHNGAIVGINENIRKFYTAASRAREKLYILNDLGEECIVNDIIMNKDGESLYDRR